jgi:hypothetical protein
MNEQPMINVVLEHVPELEEGQGMTHLDVFHEGIKGHSNNILLVNLCFELVIQTPQGHSAKWVRV